MKTKYNVMVSKELQENINPIADHTHTMLATGNRGKVEFCLSTARKYRNQLQQKGYNVYLVEA